MTWTALVERCAHNAVSCSSKEGSLPQFLDHAHKAAQGAWAGLFCSLRMAGHGCLSATRPHGASHCCLVVAMSQALATSLEDTAAASCRDSRMGARCVQMHDSIAPTTPLKSHHNTSAMSAEPGTHPAGLGHACRCAPATPAARPGSTWHPHPLPPQQSAASLRVSPGHCCHLLQGSKFRLPWSGWKRELAQSR